MVDINYALGVHTILFKDFDKTGPTGCTFYKIETNNKTGARQTRALRTTVQTCYNKVIRFLLFV